MTKPVWNQFLTPRDLELAERLPVVERGLGDRPALLMIDLYRNSFGTRRLPLLEAIEQWPASCGEGAWDAIPHLQQLLDSARRVSMPVIHVTGLPDVPSWRDSRIVVGQGPSLQQRREQFEIVEELQPAEGELVIRKSAPSAFWGTILPGVLNQAGVDSLIVAGQATSGCIRATVVDACSYRYKVVVPEECVFDRTEASHAINLFDMSQKYADVIGVDRVLAMLSNAEQTAS